MNNADSGIKYIRPDAQTPPLSERQGRRYEALVPATLDLADRARIAINGMTGPTDPDADYYVYWKLSFRHNPPVVYHQYSDLGVQAKFMESVPRMRMMSDSEQDQEVEQAWKQMLLRMIGPDGSVWNPQEGHPWLRPSVQYMGFSGFTGFLQDAEHLVDSQINGLMLGAVATYAVLEDREFWEPIGQRIVEGLQRLVVSDGHSAYFPTTIFGPGQKPDPAAPRPVATEAAFAMWPASRLIHFYRATGYEPALKLAGELCRYVVEQGEYFGPNFEFLNDAPDPNHPRHYYIHFHHHAMTIRACLDYMLAAGEDQLLDFVVPAFAKAKTYGECLTGFFPENVNPMVPQTCEICEVADMIRIAVQLAEAGLGDEYWDDADKWVRNQLVEGQLVRTDWVDRLHHGDPPSQLSPGMGMVTDRALERNIGGFAGWQAPNDWVESLRQLAPFEYNPEQPVTSGIMHCCTGNGTRGLYDVWRSIVTTRGQEVRVNLLLNRASPEVDVNSHLPYTGQVDLDVKRNCKLSVRLPGWVQLSAVQCVVDNAPRSVSFEGRYAQVGEIKANQTVTLSFPIEERTDRVTMKSMRYFLVRKGHDIVFIDPPGKRCPLYQRDHYRDNVTLWKKATRYIDEQTLDW